MDNIRCAAIVPIYNHGKTLQEVVSALEKFGLSAIIVDDGSDASTKKNIKLVCENFSSAVLVRREKNGGKGAAVADGLRTAKKRGYTHALQVDADAQHDLSLVPKFLDTLRDNPNCLIAGFPQYDYSAPKSRLIGRKITNFWVAAETLSFDIRDAMCGFRIYPVDKCCDLAEKGFCSYRMGFDIEILVRLHWLGVHFIFIPINVFYPKDNKSHFRTFGDNFEISKIHTILFFGMLLRFPSILARKIFGRGAK